MGITRQIRTHMGSEQVALDAESMRTQGSMARSWVSALTRNDRETVRVKASNQLIRTRKHTCIQNAQKWRGASSKHLASVHTSHSCTFSCSSSTWSFSRASLLATASTSLFSNHTQPIGTRAKGKQRTCIPACDVLLVAVTKLLSERLASTLKVGDLLSQPGLSEGRKESTVHMCVNAQSNTIYCMN
jgi:hypothetical protein